MRFKILKSNKRLLRPILEAEGYWACKEGQIYSTRQTKRKKMKQRKNSSGYLCINLMIKNKNTTKTVHRLIAKAFIPNLEGKPCINHIDGNKINNCIDNLEWCTQSENILHAFKIGRKVHSPVNKKPVQQLSLSSKLLAIYESTCEAARVTGIKVSGISSCCNNRIKTAGGFKWRFC